MSGIDLKVLEHWAYYQEAPMAKCNCCDADTQLYLSGLPICIKCLEEADLKLSPLPPERETETGKGLKLVKSARTGV
jgi:hypothetical protein